MNALLFLSKAVVLQYTLLTYENYELMNYNLYIVIRVGDWIDHQTNGRYKYFITLLKNVKDVSVIKDKITYYIQLYLL